MNLTVSPHSANCSSEFKRPSGLSGVDPLGVMAGRMLTSLLRRVTDGCSKQRHPTTAAEKNRAVRRRGRDPVPSFAHKNDVAFSSVKTRVSW